MAVPNPLLCKLKIALDLTEAITIYVLPTNGLSEVFTLASDCEIFMKVIKLLITPLTILPLLYSSTRLSDNTQLILFAAIYP